MSQSLTSPLTLASLMAGNTNALAMDPATAAALPRLQLAQQMMQSGMSDAPTSKWGALSRVGQSMLGNYMFGQANSGIQDILKQRQANLSGALNYVNGNGSPTPATTPTPPQATQSGLTPPAQQPTPLSGAVHQMESSNSMKPGITGDGGQAAGPMQVHAAALQDVNSAFGTHYSMDDITRDPTLGKWAGDRYLQLQQQRFPGRPDLALAAYNAGPTATANAGGPGVAAVPAAAAPYVAKGMALAGQPPSQVSAANTSTNGPSASGPSVQDIVNKMATVHQLMAANPYDPQFQTQMQGQLDLLKTRLGVAQGAVTVDPTTHIQTKGTGEQTGAAAPAPRFTVDPRTGIQTNANTGQQEGAATPASRFAVDPATGVQTNLNTGQQVNPAEPRPDYKPDPNIPGALTSPGQKPVFPPVGRSLNVPGMGVVTTQPGQAPSVAIPQNPKGLSEAAEATSQGSTTGTQAAATFPRMVKLGSESAQNIGTIDSATAQLNAAAAKGLPTGYFGPEWAKGLAAMKNLGVNTASLGVDPSAVGDIQAGNKSLALVAGGIIRNILGPDTNVTDAKVQQFVHATPGLETDPAALQKILGWARSQSVYNHDMAMDAMKNADPSTGMIAPNWESQYYQKQGSFGPIYNPLHGEMEQPKGQSPTATPPQQTQATPPAASKQPSIEELQAEARKRGLLK